MQPRSVTGVILGSFCVLAGAPRAGADVVVESQNRSIEAGVREWRHDNTLDEDVQVFSQRETAQAPDAGPFDRSLTVQYIQSYGHASQTSTIAPNRFAAQGSIGVYDQTDIVFSAGIGHSLYDVTFRADAPQGYVLNYDRTEDNFATDDGLRWTLRVDRLDQNGQSTTVFSAPEALRDPFNPYPPPPEPLTGVLPAGRYEFLFDTSQESDFHSNWNYSFQLDLTTVPEPAAFIALPALILPLLRPRRTHPAE